MSVLFYLVFMTISHGEEGACHCAGCLLACPRFVVSRLTSFPLGDGMVAVF